VEDNPGSADAKMVLGMQLRDPDEQEKVFKEAYNQNSHIRMLNQILGKFAMNHDQNAEAKEYFLKELKLTKLPETYSCLAHIYISTGMLDSGAFCLQKSIDLSIRDKGLKDDFNPDLLQEACHNLVLVYLNQNQKDKALGVISQMRKNDLTVPQDMLDLIAKP
jgi:tetratricopeptide (TPR) repeat protein